MKQGGERAEGVCWRDEVQLPQMERGNFWRSNSETNVNFVHLVQLCRNKVYVPVFSQHFRSIATL